MNYTNIFFSQRENKSYFGLQLCVRNLRFASCDRTIPNQSLLASAAFIHVPVDGIKTKTEAASNEPFRKGRGWIVKYFVPLFSPNDVFCNFSPIFLWLMYWSLKLLFILGTWKQFNVRNWYCLIIMLVMIGTFIANANIWTRILQ